jgi:hypothetical protein
MGRYVAAAPGRSRATGVLGAKPRHTLLLVFASAIPSCAGQLYRDQSAKFETHMSRLVNGTVGVDTLTFIEKIFDNIDAA